MPGLADRFLGDNLRSEMEQKVKTITSTLVPLMQALVTEQKKTNELLSTILNEVRNIRRKKK